MISLKKMPVKHVKNIKHDAAAMLPLGQACRLLLYWVHESERDEAFDRRALEKKRERKVSFLCVWSKKGKTLLWASEKPNSYALPMLLSLLCTAAYLFSVLLVAGKKPLRTVWTFGSEKERERERVRGIIFQRLCCRSKLCWLMLQGLDAARREHYFFPRPVQVGRKVTYLTWEIMFLM